MWHSERWPRPSWPCQSATLFAWKWERLRSVHYFKHLRSLCLCGSLALSLSISQSLPLSLYFVSTSASPSTTTTTSTTTTFYYSTTTTFYNTTSYYYHHCPAQVLHHLITALESPGFPEVQRHALDAIKGLSEAQNNKSRIVQLNGLSILMKLVRGISWSSFCNGAATNPQRRA